MARRAGWWRSGRLGFVLANFIGITAAAVIGRRSWSASPLLALTRPDAAGTPGRRTSSEARAELAARRVSATAPRDRWTDRLPVVLAAFLWVVFDRVIVELDGVLSTGYVNNLGDLPFHLQVDVELRLRAELPTRGSDLRRHRVCLSVPVGLPRRDVRRPSGRRSSEAFFLENLFWPCLAGDGPPLHPGHHRAIASPHTSPRSCSS